MQEKSNSMPIVVQLLPIILLILNACHSPTKNMAHKQTFPRVANAYEEKWDILQAELQAKEIDTAKGIEIYLRAFKQEKALEVWVKHTADTSFRYLKTYDFCALAGILGPKRKEGDSQVPEGFYHIDRFNPKSAYHLSLGINYPNDSDRILSDKSRPGGDIFIHGDCVTIGCIPITDDKIKHLYVLATEAKEGGQEQIAVHIFPYRLTEAAIASNIKEYPQHTDFWKNLKVGYDYFEEYHRLPLFHVNSEGMYVWE